MDDWALRKRVTYGTILADLERRRAVALRCCPIVQRTRSRRLGCAHIPVWR